MLNAFLINSFSPQSKRNRLYRSSNNLNNLTFCFSSFFLNFLKGNTNHNKPSKQQQKKTIPQIFFDDQHIGGYDETRALEKENRLQELLK